MTDEKSLAELIEEKSGEAFGISTALNTLAMSMKEFVLRIFLETHPLSGPELWKDFLAKRDAPGALKGYSFEHYVKRAVRLPLLRYFIVQQGTRGFDGLNARYALVIHTGFDDHDKSKNEAEIIAFLEMVVKNGTVIKKGDNHGRLLLPYEELVGEETV